MEQYTHEVQKNRRMNQNNIVSTMKSRLAILSKIIIHINQLMDIKLYLLILWKINEEIYQIKNYNK